MKAINTKPQIFHTKDHAKSVAEILASGESDGWTFEVRENVDGGWKVAALDEEGILASYWTESVSEMVRNLHPAHRGNNK